MISAEKNKRIFDTRIKKIEEIKAVDSFLQAKGLVSAGDATYFTLLDDNWSNAGLPERYSGIKVTLGVRPGEAYKKDVEQIKGTLTDTSNIPVSQVDYTRSLQVNKSLSPFVSFAYEKPISLRWQSSTRAHFSYELVNYMTDWDQTNGMELYASAGQQFGFYPDTRTSVIMNLDISFHKYFKGINNDQVYAAPDFYIVASHYFSYKLHMDLMYHIEYGYTKYLYDLPAYYESRNFNQVVHLGLVYNIF
jgi:hypothetical protein